MLNLRYSGIVDNYNFLWYHILGCGAIGSNTAIQIAKMGGKNFTLYDYDTVGIENVAISHFTLNDIDSYKVDALANHLLNVNNDINVRTINEKFTRYSPEGDDCIILGFDNMEGRREVVEDTMKFPKRERPKILIDARMGAEMFQLYVFENPTLKEYLKHWYSDEEGSDEPCTAKATSYCANMSGSFISNAIKKILTEQPYYTETMFHFPSLMLEAK